MQSRPKRKIVFNTDSIRDQRFKKNKTIDTQARQKSTRQITQTAGIKMVVTHDIQERQRATAPTKKWRFSG